METNIKVEMSEVRVELVQEEVQKMNPVEWTAGRMVLEENRLAGPTTQTKQGIRQVTGWMTSQVKKMATFLLNNTS